MWLCNCGLKNSGLNQNCAAALTWKDETHYQVSENRPDYWQYIVSARNIQGLLDLKAFTDNQTENKKMTPQEELFARFYNHERILVKDINDIQLREHREELSKISFEAKARLVSADDETRERKAKTSNKEWLLTTADVVSTDAINAVKVRKERMSKMDKMKEQLLKAGIDEDTVKEMIRNLESKATEKNVKTITFNKPVTEPSAVQVITIKPDGEVKPFNPAALNFGAKS